MLLHEISPEAVVSWMRTGEGGDGSINFAVWRCVVCSRRETTSGNKPVNPCVCSTAMRPKRRSISGLKGQRRG